MNFLLVSCLAVFAAISLVYAAEGDDCNKKIPCEEGFVCCKKRPTSPFRGMEDMMKDMFDQMRRPSARGLFDWFRPPPPKNGTCVSRQAGSACRLCLEIPSIPNRTTVSPSTDGSTTDGSSIDGSPMSGPFWRPWSRFPPPRFGRLPRLCGEGQMCNPDTLICEAITTVAPRTTVTTTAA